MSINKHIEIAESCTGPSIKKTEPKTGGHVGEQVKTAFGVLQHLQEHRKKEKELENRASEPVNPRIY